MIERFEVLFGICTIPQKVESVQMGGTRTVISYKVKSFRVIFIYIIQDIT